MASNYVSEWSHCSFCGAGFLNEESMAEHEVGCSLRPLSDMQCRNFQQEWSFCSFCGVAYPTQNEVDEHERHCTCRGSAGEEEVEESGDDILIGQEVSAQRFQTSCYGTADERELWIKCPIGRCGQIFEQDEMLLDHMETVHFNGVDWQVRSYN